jgi:serine protease Do
MCVRGLLLPMSVALLLVRIVGAQPTQMPVRHGRVKAATVRILLNGEPAGSGFIVSAEGLIATNFHVISGSRHRANHCLVSPGRIEVELADGRKFDATLADAAQSADFNDSCARDVALLQIKADKLAFLQVGSFHGAAEGESVYLAGFPLGIDQPIVAVGMLTTKWKRQNIGNPGIHEVAWLDITINAGNSGGPVVIANSDPNTDRVIGVATFNLNPFNDPAEDLLASANKYPPGMRTEVRGVDFRSLADLVGRVVQTNSYGVAGCVSTEYLSARIQRTHTRPASEQPRRNQPK